MNQHHWAEGEEARRRYVTAIFMRLRSRDRRHRSGQRRPQSRIPASRPARSRCSLRPPGTPLGLLPGMRYSSRTSPVPARRPAAFLHRWTHRSLPGEMRNLGRNAFWMNFLRARRQNADGILDALWTALDRFCRGRPAGRRHDRTGAVPREANVNGDAGMSATQDHHGRSSAALAHGL